MVHLGSSQNLPALFVVLFVVLVRAQLPTGQFFPSEHCLQSTSPQRRSCDGKLVSDCGAKSRPFKAGTKHDQRMAPLLDHIKPALGLALAVTFSCFSRSTVDTHVMSASPLHLVNGLQAFIKGGATILNTTEGQSDSAFPEFELDALPDKYLFGVTGVCRQFFSNHTTSCSRRFGQNPSILSVILSDLTSSTASQSWIALLNSSGISTVQQEGIWQRLSTASAALLVCSIVCPCIAAIWIIIYHPYYWKIIIASDVISGAMAVAAASMWTVMFVSCTSQYSYGTDKTLGDYLDNTGFSTTTDNSGPDLRPALIYGPGFAILWAAAGSHVTILMVAAAAVIISLWFISAAMEGHGAAAIEQRQA